ncbi:MAG: MarC family protein [Elusimicrobiales bacterium]|nr:MarC family protein [Elusimicrobiales bacterium]
MISKQIYDFTDAVFFSFFALFPILNPPAMSPVFNKLTSHLDEKKQEKIAFLVAKYSFFLLFTSSIIGIWILKIFGISVGAIKIAGGVLLLNTAWKMLNQNETVKDIQNDLKIDENKAFYPMTLPLTSGPGSISVAVSIGPDIEKIKNISEIFKTAGVIFGIFLASLSVYVFYKYSSIVIKKLDDSKKHIISNISAFILFTISVQIVSEGIKLLSH